MKTLRTVAATGLVVLGIVNTINAETPQLFKEKAFHCATLANAANYYIGLGSQRSFDELHQLAEDSQKPNGLEFDLSARIGWVCRIVFEGKDGQPLRGPIFGRAAIPVETMPRERWPRLPVAESNGVYFVVSRGYRLAGHPERTSHYIEYCIEHGNFRKMKLRVPKREEALVAFDALIQHQRWKSIKWKHEQPHFKYEYSEKWAVRFIREQATSIP
ncbi:hypothetical protein OAS39_06955 [Pirellulales bacterium]|nr:hypothetical protein [Pirellulales bacterium]